MLGITFWTAYVHILNRWCYFLGYRSTDETRTDNN